MPKKVTILIADDHAIVRKVVKTLLEECSQFEVVAEAETGIEAVQKAQAIRPDIAILDIRMPGMSGIEACRQIKQANESCIIIMMTSYAENEMLFAAIQAGAAGYILKQITGSELIHAIERISTGEGLWDSVMMMSALKRLNVVSEELEDGEQLA